MNTITKQLKLLILAQIFHLDYIFLCPLSKLL